jgi:hypothetical protein
MYVCMCVCVCIYVCVCVCVYVYVYDTHIFLYTMFVLLVFSLWEVVCIVYKPASFFFME